MSQRWAKSHLHRYYSPAVQNLLYEFLALLVVTRQQYRTCSKSYYPPAVQNFLYESSHFHRYYHPAVQNLLYESLALRVTELALRAIQEHLGSLEGVSHDS